MSPQTLPQTATPSAASSGNLPSPEYVQKLTVAELTPGQLNLVVFGPGKGEACLLQFPDSSLGIVDGCGEPSGSKKAKEQGQGDPMRELLTELDEAARQAGQTLPRIRFVCVTHPHDDHYAGLGRLMQNFTTRIEEVWVTAPVSERYSKVLLSWVESSRAGKDFPLPDSEQVEGLKRVIEQVKAHRHHQRRAVISLSENKHPLNKTIEGHPLSVYACGPADADIDQGLDELLHELRTKVAQGRSKSRTDPNRTSAALVVRWGQAGILLGGDLLNGHEPHTGWQRAAQLHCLGADAGPIQVVNVAHHASKEAHYEPLWLQLKPLLAIVTPFRHAIGPAGHGEGSGNPPRPEMIRTLCRTSRVIITRPPVWNPAWKPPQPAHNDLKTAFERGDYWCQFGKTSLAPSGGVNARRNAVAVSLDAQGQIQRIVLAGEADEYR